MPEDRIANICKMALRRALKLKAEDEIDMRWLEFIVCFSELVENDEEYARLSDKDLEIFFEQSFIEYLHKDEEVIEFSEAQKKQMRHDFLVLLHENGEIKTAASRRQYNEAMQWEIDGIVQPFVLASSEDKK
ncbi:MAG: hypothetical protein WAV51_02465 [Microgenomates group bacterium]